MQRIRIIVRSTTNTAARTQMKCPQEVDNGCALVMGLKGCRGAGTVRRAVCSCGGLEHAGLFPEETQNVMFR